LAAWHPAETLAQTPTERVATLVAQGDSAWNRKSFQRARTAYAEAFTADSGSSSRAVYRLGLLCSWDGQLDPAIRFFRQYVRLEPRDAEGRIALARTFAWKGDPTNAVAIYDSILVHDRTYRDAALGAAQSLAWGARFGEAIARYDRWIAANPKDVEAELARARTLAWAGRLSRSEQAYRMIAERGEQLEAEKGIALVAAWRGDLSGSERLWRGIAERYPKDAESRVGLAQVLRWAGRPEDARDALAAAAEIDPANPDAAIQRRWVRAELASAVEPSVAATWDSDDNASVVVNAGVSTVPFPRARLTISASHRTAERFAVSGRSDLARASLRTRLGPVLSLTADLGLVNTNAESGLTPPRTRTAPSAAVNAWAQLTPQLGIGGHLQRTAFDETAALLWSEIDVTSAGVDAGLALPGRVSLGAGGELASFRGGSGPNHRRLGYGRLAWRARRSLTLSLAGRAFGYDSLAHDGYFAPSVYRQGEAGIRFAPGRDLGWAGWIDLGLGIQQVGFGGPTDSRPTERIGVGIVRRPSPGTELGLEYSFSNVSATTATSATSLYHSHVLGLRVRLIW
jgi:tetratricopeptide (TPR) repeat protein